VLTNWVNLFNILGVSFLPLDLKPLIGSEKAFTTIACELHTHFVLIG